MSEYRIYLSPPAQNGSEAAALLQTLESNWLAPVGPALQRFEEDLKHIQGDKEILALNSGTSAIHLALKLAGVGAGDEVLVASLTHNATINPIIYQGATPVFVDSEINSWNISPAFLKEAIENRVAKQKRVKAILIVHLYGMPANMNAIVKIAQEYGIPVIEDAAEALGSSYNNVPLGSIGEYGILSFNGNKIVTTSGGGALILQSNEEREHALYLATQARDQAPHFQHSEIGYNYRLSNVLAALGSAQLQNLNEKVTKRRDVFNQYLEAFSKLNNKFNTEIVTTSIERNSDFSNRWLSTFLVHPYNEITAETWRLALLKAGIEARPLWKPMHLQPVFQSFPFYGNKTSNQIFANGICLPSGTNLTSKEVSEITEIISSLYT